MFDSSPAPAPDTSPAGAPSGSSAPIFRFVDAPFFEDAEWEQVIVDRQGRHFCRANETVVEVVRDAAGNWCSVRGEVQVFTPEGAIFRPADDPICLPDFDLERAIVRTAAARLREGRHLNLEDTCRADLARRRLAAWEREAAA